MIDVYSWPTPNGHKVHIMLEECGLDWQVHAINIGAGDQFAADFLRISPNNRIPAIIDHEGINEEGGESVSLFESGAILLYLAEKSGKFMPAYGHDDYFTCLQWLMWQMGGVGPMFGQAHHFRLYADDEIPYAIDRYTKESNRLCGVMDKRLAETAYLAGDDYTIADIATYPWVRLPERKGIDFADYPNLQRWFDAISARDGVKRGLETLSEHVSTAPPSKEAKDNMFGDKQFKKR